MDTYLEKISKSNRLLIDAIESYNSQILNDQMVLLSYCLQIKPKRKFVEIVGSIEKSC